jgi:hypothetical protein
MPATTNAGRLSIEPNSQYIRFHICASPDYGESGMSRSPNRRDSLHHAKHSATRCELLLSATLMFARWLLGTRRPDLPVIPTQEG